MWFWITRRFRLWLLFAIGAPVAGWVLGAVGDALERRGGETSATRALGKARDWSHDHARGPLGRRRGRGRGGRSRRR